MGSSTLDAYTLDDLDELTRERPELGRIEIIGGTLVAGGAEMTGDRHQAVVQAIFVALLAEESVDQVIRLDTYWFDSDIRIRPDVAIWNATDRPHDGGAFTVPPLAVIEVLLSDADHDLVRKADVYRRHGVAAWFVDPRRRYEWWLSDAAGTVDDSPVATITLPGRTDLELSRSIIDA